MRANRNRKAASNRPTTLPTINIGDYVLVANPIRISKLMFKWVGPMIVTDTINPFVYRCKPATTRNLRERNVHVTRIRRFSGMHLNVTAQIQTSIDRDFPANEVQAITAHKINKRDGQLYLEVQWLGFTKAERTWEPAEQLHQDVPEHVRAYTFEHKRYRPCEYFFQRHYEQN